MISSRLFAIALSAIGFALIAQSISIAIAHGLSGHFGHRAVGSVLILLFGGFIIGSIGIIRWYWLRSADKQSAPDDIALFAKAQTATKTTTITPAYPGLDDSTALLKPSSKRTKT